MPNRNCRKLAQDDEYALFSVTLFRRVKDEFAQKAREKKCVWLSLAEPSFSRALDGVKLTCLCGCCRFIVRDFTYDEEEIEKQKKDVEDLLVEEKEMWVREALKLAMA